MKTSNDYNSNSNNIQIEIIPQRILSIETANKLLNEIYKCEDIVRVMIQGSNLPDSVLFGPGKGEIVSHPLKKLININGTDVNLKTTVGRILIETTNEKTSSLIYEKCKSILPFKFEYYKGIFFKNKATLVDYAKFGTDSDYRLLGLSDPKKNIDEYISYINTKE